jgi:hypothetical protein
MKSRWMAVHEPAVREVVKTLPLTRLQNEMIEAGYRRIAVKYHPDKGGDTVKMQALNAEMARARAALKVTTKSFTVEDEDL